MNDRLAGEKSLLEMINQNSIASLYRCTPFADWGVYDYHGKLKPDYFFANLFVDCEQEVYKSIYENIYNRSKKTIVLFGYQGSGKTTFIRAMKEQIGDSFLITDFDRDTSNPSISEYIEKYARMLCDTMALDIKDNGSKGCHTFLRFYKKYGRRIYKPINAENKIMDFFSKFEQVLSENDIEKMYAFVNVIDKLFFGQILALIVLWYINKFIEQDKIEKTIFCMDNVDVMVDTKEISEFFEQYFTFTRNIESVIRRLKDNNNGMPMLGSIGGEELIYAECFTFIIGVRDTTWSKVHVNIHQERPVKQESYIRDVSLVFSSKDIIDKRNEYVQDHKNVIDQNFCNLSEQFRIIVNDLHEMRKGTIFRLFNGDYRTGIDTLWHVIDQNQEILNEYRKVSAKKSFMYGARGIVFKALFELFYDENYFSDIGVLNVKNKNGMHFSDARLILSYLSNNTKSALAKQSIALDKLYNDFAEYMDMGYDEVRKRVNSSIVNMFELHESEYWSHLVTFHYVKSGDYANLFSHLESLTREDCRRVEIHITPAGREFLDLISTHFEFFSCRCMDKRKEAIPPLFYSRNLEFEDGKYAFQEIIEDVLDIVKSCCEDLNEFNRNHAFMKFKSKAKYIDSPFVYKPIIQKRETNRPYRPSKKKILHGERILHTHIRYLDYYRRYILCSLPKKEQPNKCCINELMVDYIEQYLEIGKNCPCVCSRISEDLFPAFENAILKIRDSGYNDIKTPINTGQNILFER